MSDNEPRSPKGHATVDRIPPGKIPERVPRPLTEDQKARVLERDLEKLANKFASPRRTKVRDEPTKSSKSNNGWQ